MKNLKKIFWGVLFISALTVSYVQFESVSTFQSDLLNFNQATAEAEAGGDCSSNGYKNWNGSYSNPDGVDCWCTDRDDVSTACS